MIRKIQQYALNASLFCAAATCFFMPFSSSLLSLFSILTIFFWLFSGRITLFPRLARSNLAVLFSFILFLLFISGILYSSASFEYSLSIFKKYREVIYIPILFSLFYGTNRASRYCEISFLCGCIFLLFVSYAMYFSLLPSDRYGNSLVYHITHSYFMAILAYFSLHRLFENKKIRWGWLPIVVLTVINLFYIAPGRTGMLVFIFLILLLLFQLLSLKKFCIGLVVFVIAGSAVFLTSENFSTRSKAAYQEIQEYHYGDSRTSLGMRFDWWITSLRLIMERPVFGHGTGSYAREHERMIQGTKIETTDNPHNEYLFIAEQLGMVGLLAFLLLLLSQIFHSFRLREMDRFYLQGVVLAMATGCLMNSFLFDSHQGHFWAFLSALFLSRQYSNDQSGHRK